MIYFLSSQFLIIDLTNVTNPVSTYHFYCHYTEVSVQLHAPAALTRKRIFYTPEEEAG